MSAIAGYVCAEYEVRVVDNDDMVLDTFSIPIGKTTLLLSSNVKSIEIVSFCNISDGKYKKLDSPEELHMRTLMN